MDEYRSVLSDKDHELLREIEAMGDLDEDALLELHRRVRRARTKRVGNYRRRAATRVGEKGSRGHAEAANAKARHRAAAFEEMLAVVSARLAQVAHEQAEELKDQRLAAARAGRSTGPGTESAGDGKVSAATSRARSHSTTPAAAKKNASSLAAGARRQAGRDAR